MSDVQGNGLSPPASDNNSAAPPTNGQAAPPSNGEQPANNEQQAGSGTPPESIPLPASEAFRHFGNKQVMVPTAAFKTIKEEARTKGLEAGVQQGREAYEAELSEKLAKTGFSDLDRLLDFATGLGGNGAASKGASAPPTNGEQPPAEATPPPPPAADAPPADAEWRRELFAVRQSDEQMQGLNEALTAQLAAKDAEIRVREAMARKGVRDVDYAYTLLGRETASLDEGARAQYNVAEWLGGLNKTHAYLFGDAPKAPANTGPVNDGQQSALDPGQVAGATDNGAFDASKASKAEFQQHLRKLGYAVPGY